MTKIVHCKQDKYDRYIGRPDILGNPFKIGKDGTREEVIEKYKLYALKRIEQDLIFAKEVESCKDQVLGCWCKPKACHGDVIAALCDNNDRP